MEPCDCGTHCKTWLIFEELLLHTNRAWPAFIPVVGRKPSSSSSRWVDLRGEVHPP